MLKYLLELGMKSNIEENKKRNKFYCPKEFLEWIELVNYCPNDKDFLMIKNNLMKYFSEEMINNELKKDRELFKKYWLNSKLNRRPLEHQYQKIKGTKPSSHHIFELFKIARILRVYASRNYTPIVTAEEKALSLALKDIAIKVETGSHIWNASFELEESESHLEELSDERKSTTFEIELHIKHDTYFFKPRESEFINLIIKEDIDIRNIKLCSSCKKNIFWLKREKQKTCSLRCRNKWNLENWRKENREKENKQRCINYKIKKERKAKKKNLIVK